MRNAAVRTRRPSTKKLVSGIDRFWARNLPAMGDATRATQLACLEQYLGDRELAQGIRVVAWSALSRACHHHAYERA